jgi:hypothetical protein
VSDRTTSRIMVVASRLLDGPVRPTYWRPSAEVPRRSPEILRSQAKPGLWR